MYLFLLGTIAFAGALALHPLGRLFVYPLVGLVVLVAIAAAIGIAKSIREVVAISRDRRTRVTHGLEHACLAVLREQGHETLGGVTKPGRFIVGIARGVSYDIVRDAAREAVRRVREGETSLAYSPHCGTSALVGAALFTVIVLGCTLGSIMLGVGIGPAFMAAAVLGVIAMGIHERLGLFAQRTLTVSTRFADARVGDVKDDSLGDRRAYSVPITVTL